MLPLPAPPGWRARVEESERQMTTIFQEWEAGAITDTQCIRALASDLGELESDLTPMQKAREELRDEFSRVLAHAGGKADVPGFGSLALTAASITNSYDSKRLDDLVLSLIAEGYGEIAESIAACRKQTARAGSLRIVRER